MFHKDKVTGTEPPTTTEKSMPLPPHVLVMYSMQASVRCVTIVLKDKARGAGSTVATHVAQAWAPPHMQIWNSLAVVSQLATGRTKHTRQVQGTPTALHATNRGTTYPCNTDLQLQSLADVFFKIGVAGSRCGCPADCAGCRAACALL